MRAGARCFECSAPATADHHVIPESKGGRKTVPLCAGCLAKVTRPKPRTPDEQADIENQIRRLKTAGLSLRKIAEVLRSRGVYPKRGRGYWHPSSIARVLSRTESAPRNETARLA
jgi:hypothetical protein